MQETHLIRVLRAHAQAWQERPALRAKVAGQWQDVTWAALGQSMEQVAQGLIRLGHQVGDRVGLCARNMPEWTQMDLGILAARGVPVPLYPTSSFEQARYIIRDAGIQILVAGEQAQVDLALQLLEAGEISQIIALDAGIDLKGCQQALSFQALMAMGLSVGEQEPFAQELGQRRQDYRLDDLLTLVYTSGTTGEPKGVMLDHANLSAVMRLHQERLAVGPEDVSLCMLPLTHVYERVWTYIVLTRGGLNVYLRDPQTVIQVIGEVKPTLMCAVPRVYEKAYAGIQAKMEKAHWLTRGLFHWSMAVGMAVVQLRIQDRAPGPWLALKRQLAERLVFHKLRALFGGRCHFFPVGGGSLADEVNLFFQAIGLNLKFGYGLTETCATVACYEDGQLPIGTVGRPLDGLELKLGPDHEILVKGPTVMRGYFNRPEETAKVMTADGFLHTGDAGSLDAKGHLIFLERIKELMKTSNGQYVAPQKVEGALGKDPFIEQIAIVADCRSFVCALIVPAFAILEAQARLLGLKQQSLTELLANPQIVEFFEKRIQVLQKSLAKHEQVKKFTLLPRAFSLELGELTPTLKLRRKPIEAAFKLEIDAMYLKPAPTY